MARVNPQVEHLEKVNAMLRKQIESMRAEPGDIPILACDHSCVCATAHGQATNGGCRCDERKLRQAVQWWRRRAEFLQITIQDMRSGAVVEPAPNVRCACCDNDLYCEACDLRSETAKNRPDEP